MLCYTSADRSYHVVWNFRFVERNSIKVGKKERIVFTAIKKQRGDRRHSARPSHTSDVTRSRQQAKKDGDLGLAAWPVRYAANGGISVGSEGAAARVPARPAGQLQGTRGLPDTGATAAAGTARELGGSLTCCAAAGFVARRAVLATVGMLRSSSNHFRPPL